MTRQKPRPSPSAWLWAEIARRYGDDAANDLHEAYNAQFAPISMRSGTRPSRLGNHAQSHRGNEEEEADSMADRQRRIEGTRRRDRALVMSATCLVVMLVLALFALIALAVMAWPMVP